MTLAIFDTYMEMMLEVMLWALDMEVDKVAKFLTNASGATLSDTGLAHLGTSHTRTYLTATNLTPPTNQLGESSEVRKYRYSSGEVNVNQLFSESIR